MGGKVGEPKARQTGLAHAENFAFAAQSQIFFSDAKSVLGLADDHQPRLRRFA